MVTCGTATRTSLVLVLTWELSAHSEITTAVWPKRNQPKLAAKPRQLILAGFSLRAALVGLGADPRVAANQQIHREARWLAMLASETPSGGGGVRSVCGSLRVQGRSSRSALFSVSGLFCSLCGPHSSCGLRRSRISRALRVCRVPSPKTRHHLNPRSPRPGTVPVRTGQKARLLALPMWLGAALQFSALLAYPLRSGGFLRVRKQS